MKKTALLLMLALTFALSATAAYSAKTEPGVPDVTGVYQGENTRFLPENAGVDPTAREAIFYIWGQSGRHFWGSVMSNERDGADGSDNWQPRGYINGVIQPDNTVYFVNYFAAYSSGVFSNISPITVMTNGTFIPASGKTPKMLTTVGLRFNNNQTTSGTYTQTTSYIDDQNDGSPYNPDTAN